MVLEGWEIKAIRAGQVQLTDGYVVIRDGELFLIGCRINPLSSASTHVNPEADRTKKLLMHKEEIRRLIGKVEQKGFTLVPLEPALQGRPGEGRDRAGQGQGRARQARHREEARLGTRARPPDAHTRSARRPSTDGSSDVHPDRARRPRRRLRLREIDELPAPARPARRRQPAAGRPPRIHQQIERWVRRVRPAASASSSAAARIVHRRPRGDGRVAARSARRLSPHARAWR